MKNHSRFKDQNKNGRVDGSSRKVCCQVYYLVFMFDFTVTVRVEFDCMKEFEQYVFWNKHKCYNCQSIGKRNMELHIFFLKQLCNKTVFSEAINKAVKQASSCQGTMSMQQIRTILGAKAKSSVEWQTGLKMQKYFRSKLSQLFYFHVSGE